MSASETLKGTKRAKVGTRSAKKLRAEGQVPANIQGEGKEHMDFSIDMRDFLATRRHHTHLYDIDIDGNLEAALVRELQYDAFGDSIIHVEFKRVIRGQKTDAEVPLEFVGQPKSGQLNHLMNTIHISCLPSLIPDSIEVRIGELGEGDAVHAADITLPDGMDLLTAGDDLVASISTIKVVVEDTDEPEEDLGDITGAGPTPDGDGDSDGA